MKGLNEFLTMASKDTKVLKKIESAKDVNEVVSIANECGYNFTVKELMDEQMENVSGGKLENLTADLKLDLKMKIAKIKQNIKGNQNEQTNAGNITVN